MGDPETFFDGGERTFAANESSYPFCGVGCGTTCNGAAHARVTADDE